MSARRVTAVGASAPVKHSIEAVVLKSMRDRRWTLKQAQAVLEAQERSGLSVQTFAHEHDLSAERLYYWRRRLETSDGVREMEDEDIKFVPVTVTSRGRTTVAVRVRAGNVEIEVADPTMVDPGWLATTISMLRERRCS